MFPIHRGRRLRRSETLRRMVREVSLSINDLIYPLFVTGGCGVRNPVDSMPGVNQLSVDVLVEEELPQVVDLGIPAIILFGIPEYKDSIGSSAYDPEEAVQRALREIKKKFPHLILITDVCLCEYTSHGHCGIIEDGEVVNDTTLSILAKVALSHAQAGADIIAPSDMMDGRVWALRRALDENGYSHLPILSYAVKYASAFYGPFRDAAGSAPQFGDRRSYQMDPPNAKEAIKEALSDIEEGADMIMVKPALAYMDIITTVKEKVNVPVAAYNVSGEYSMIKAAASKGWIDEKRIVMETLTGLKRAGADLILTYYAKDAARWLKGE